GAGIDELLGLVVRMVVEPNTPVVTSLGAYPTFNYHVTGFGGQLHQVLYRDDHIDLELLAEEVNRVRAPLVFLANPDNPMGTWHGAEQVQEFIDRLPEDCILILDEAYTDFGEDDIRPPIDTTDPRVIRMRTFSKAHGMAGARIGYAIAASEVVTGLNKIRNHFGVNRIAQAGALASMQDPKFLDEVVQEVKRGRVEYDELARRLGLSTVPSATNFVAFDLGDRTTARRVMNALLERDVFVRMPAVPPLDRCVRVTVGTPEERQFFSEVLAEVLKATHRDKR
ncbi:MAG: aminotransferase class I/II-fold pyridoxal phosphate-dependent enzyme, partial [Gammaproteobacteria bacterium]|nr:aminotransferase class I/II-fold pyridoxal phosphate-dependent enzyme [Gammaproteobacteria bacterium]